MIGTVGDRHRDREATYAYDVTVPSTQNGLPDAEASQHDPLVASKAIERRDDAPAAAYTLNATRESEPDVSSDDALTDDPSAHLEASSVFPSHRIARLRG